MLNIQKYYPFLLFIVLVFKNIQQNLSVPNCYLASI